MKKLSLQTFLLIAIATLFNCAPSVNPALEAQIDAELAAAPKSAVIPAPTVLEPLPLAVGQWIKSKYVDKKGRATIFEYKVVGSEGDAFWLENKVTNYSSVSITKILTKLDRMNPENTEILKVFTKTDDYDPTPVEGPVLTMTKGLYKKIIQSMTINWNSSGQKDVTVPAGTFEQCYIINSDVSFGLYAHSSTGFFHSAVPLNGMVQTMAEDGTMELLDFGTSGATASF